jgi:hypothetical protein
VGSPEISLKQAMVEMPGIVRPVMKEKLKPLIDEKNKERMISD